MQKILPYSIGSAAMPVVCSCQSCYCYRYLQQEKSTLSPPIREVRNEKELTKSASAIDPADLLSPMSHHHPMNTTRGTTSTRTPYYSSRCHRWEMSRRREPDDRDALLLLLSYWHRVEGAARSRFHTAINRRCVGRMRVTAE